MASIATDQTQPTLLWSAEHWSRRTPLLLVLLGLATLLITGTFGPGGAATWIQAAGIGILGVFGARILARRFGFADEAAGRQNATDDLIAGCFALLALHVALRFCGSLTLELYPLSYVLVAYLASVNRRQVGTVLIATAAALELAAWLAGHPVAVTGDATPHVLMRVGFIITFGLLYAGFHQAVLMRSKRDARQAVLADQHRIELRGRELGLGDPRTNQRSQLSTSSQLSRTSGVSDLSIDQLDRKTHRDRMLANAITGCEKASFQSLRLLKHGLRARSAVLLWLDDNASSFRVREVVSDARQVTSKTIPVGSGVLGGIQRRQETLNLKDLSPSFRGIPYYKGNVRVGAFLGTPVTANGELRGILCVDRESTQAFTASDARVVQEAADQLVHTIQNEGLIMDMEQTRYELGRFYEASRSLATALHLDEVLEVSLDTIRSIAAFDMAAITLFDPQTRMHTVARVSGRDLQGLEGEVFQNDNGLVSATVKLRHYLPCNGDFRDSRSWVFSRLLQKKARLKGVQSLLVLPLIARDEVIGTLVVGARADGAFPRERREMLEVVANQVAVAIVNAKMYSRMEKLATTDGLTRLLNRRTFLERMDDALARADRSSIPGSVILTDIDFFKKVNDTYGHAKGDEVLRRVADIFNKTLRCTDIVGRYGGEEFVIYLEDTDLEGGRQMAERLREAVSSLRFDSKQGPFNVTVSLGIAEYGSDSWQRDELIDCADKALYACKDSGRNCSLAFRDLG